MIVMNPYNDCENCAHWEVYSHLEPCVSCRWEEHGDATNWESDGD